MIDSVVISVVFMAAFVPTPQAAVFRDVVFGVLHGRGYSDSQIADLLGIGRVQLAVQKAMTGREHLSAYRVASLPIDLQSEIFGQYLRTLGWTVIEDARLGKYLTSRLDQFEKRERRQLKMALDRQRTKASA